MKGKFKVLTAIIIMAVFFGCNDKADNTQANSSTGNAALDKLNNLISKDSTDHTLLYERAQLYYENRYYDGVIEDLNKAIAMDSLQPGYYHLLSDAYMDYFKSKDALITMEQCVDLFPKRIPSMLKLAETQLILKQYDSSLQTCSNILSINAQNGDAYFLMGMNLRSMGDIPRAKNAFRKATEFDPELTDAWIILGQIFEDESDPRALDYYDAAINIDRENPLPWHSKAYYLQNAGRVEEALDIYRQINIIDKTYLDAYLNAGLIYMSMDSIENAFEQFDIMVKTKPQFYLSYYYRGMAHENMGRLEAAKEDYNTSLRLNTKFDKAQRALARIMENEIEGTN
jgi:tetratricopeptide (TPR) repeat protein